MMKIAAAELAPRKIRVNAVSPGPIKTKILEKIGLSGEQLDSLKSDIVQRIPLLQMGEAADVGKLVAYLSGEASAFITGAEILMDGGMSL